MQVHHKRRIKVLKKLLLNAVTNEQRIKLREALREAQADAANNTPPTLTGRRRIRKRAIKALNQNGKCHYCQCALTDMNISIDHKTPKSKGGKDANSNLVAACRSCNSKKRDKFYRQFFPKSLQRKVTG